METKNFTIYEIPEKEIFAWKLAALKSYRKPGVWAREVLNREAEKMREVREPSYDEMVGRDKKEEKREEMKKERRDRIAGETRKSDKMREAGEPLETRVNVMIGEVAIDEIDADIEPDVEKLPVRTTEGIKYPESYSGKGIVEVAKLPEVKEEPAKAKVITTSEEAKAYMKRMEEARKEQEKRLGRGK